MIDVQFRIMKNHYATLSSLRNMLRNGLDPNIQQKVITHKGRSQKLVFEKDFLKHKWTIEDMDVSFYTEPELRKLHKNFGHPSVNALHNLLKRANPLEDNPSLRREIEEVTRRCDPCAVFEKKPRRFKISIGIGNMRLNHILDVDVMYLNSKPVLHIVDEATHFAAAAFLKRMTSYETWKTLLRCWTRVYLGPPDHLKVDQGSYFVLKVFLDCAQTAGISIIEAPVESPSTMTHVERYHAPLRKAYNKIRSSMAK